MGILMKTRGKVEIHKKKILAYEWDYDKQSWKKELTITGKTYIPLYYDYIVEFHEGVTVSDFIKHLMKHDEDISMSLCSYMSTGSIKPFYKQMQKRNKKTFSTVGFFWNVASFDGHVDLEPSFYGVILEPSTSSVTRHELDLIQVSTYKNANIELYNDFFIEEIDTNDSGQIINNDVIFSGHRLWTLFDILSAFLKELTSLGSPESKQDIIDDVKKSILKQRNSVEHKEEIMNMQLNDLKGVLKNAESKEDYETASKIKKEIDKIELRKKSFLSRRNKKNKKNGVK